MTLLETLLAMSLLSVIALLSAQAVLTTREALAIQDQRSDMFQHLGGLLGHITRHARMAHSVVELSAPANTSGFLSITLPDDSTVKWAHDNVDLVVRYGADPPTELLATGINSLKIECFEFDGVTPTIVPADVRMIRMTASATLPAQGVPFSLSSTIWIRKQQDAMVPPFIDFYAATNSAPIGWNGSSDHTGPPDGLLSDGPTGASVDVFGFDASAQTGTVGTVLVGLYLKTDVLMDGDYFDVQLRRGSAGTLGPMHSIGQRALLRYEQALDWFWIDVTDDFAGWTYADIDGDLRVELHNRDAGVGTPTIYIDSIKVRTFETAPLTQTHWLTGLGYWQNEWENRMDAVGPPDAGYTNSTIFSVPSDDVDRQGYSYTGSWQDLGTIVRVRLLIRFFMTAAVVDDQFHARLPLITDPGEPIDTPVPITAEQVPNAVLNLYVGSATPGTVYLDFSNLEDWTWTGVRSRAVLLYMTATGVAEAEIYVDGAAVEVRYVPPTEAAVVLWEEL